MGLSPAWNQKNAWMWHKKWENLDVVAGKKVSLSWFMNSYIVKVEEYKRLHLVFQLTVPLNIEVDKSSVGEFSLFHLSFFSTLDGVGLKKWQKILNMEIYGNLKTSCYKNKKSFVSTYLYGAFDCMFLSCCVRVSEWIYTL